MDQIGLGVHYSGIYLFASGVNAAGSSLLQRPAPRETVLVNSELIKSDGDAVELNYLLRETDAGWRIIDVYLDGVYSELATRRSVYAGLIRNRGIEGLIAAIEDKIDEYESGALD